MVGSVCPCSPLTVIVVHMHSVTFDYSKYIHISNSVHGRSYTGMLVKIGCSLQTGDVVFAVST